jgi:hypothetical protein
MRLILAHIHGFLIPGNGFGEVLRYAFAFFGRNAHHKCGAADLVRRGLKKFYGLAGIGEWRRRVVNAPPAEAGGFE